MNLSPYLLFLPTDPATSRYSGTGLSKASSPGQAGPIYGEFRTASGRKRRPIQASPCAARISKSELALDGGLLAASAVIANALGFLAMTGGVLLLLRTVEISLF